MDFTLRQLEYFVAVAELGTITGAAARLHVSPSALSASLTELEGRLGVQLCVRRKAHGVSLTSSGVQVLQQARIALQSAAEIPYVAGLPGGQLHGPVTFGCYVTLAPTVLPRVLDGMLRAHPLVTVAMVEATQDSLQRKLNDGEIDLAAVYDMQISGNPQRALLYETRAHVLLAASHRLAQAPAVRLADLADEEFILLDAPPSSEHTLSLLAQQGVHPRTRHRTSSYEAVRALVGRGFGWSILVQRPSNNLSYEGLPVVVKEVEPPVRPVGVYLIWPERVTLPPRVQAVVDFAQQLDWPQVH